VGGTSPVSSSEFQTSSARHCPSATPGINHMPATRKTPLRRSAASNDILTARPPLRDLIPTSTSPQYLHRLRPCVR
jgi:hypothetical protein